MRIQHCGSRGTIFTFSDNISLYLIEASDRYFLCDTHLGPDSMAAVTEYLGKSLRKKPLIVFNSHSDWDHIWGNCAFADTMIIGHTLCRQRILENGAFDLARLASYHCGEVTLRPPNVTFSDRLVFDEAQLEFRHMPGHTADSAICIDYKDQVLFVGDLVEQPIPYLDFADLSGYIETLEWLIAYPAKVKLTAHSGIVDDCLIEQNIKYIQAVMIGTPVDSRVYQESAHVHRFNINNQFVLQYERTMAEQGKIFAYQAFRNQYPSFENYSIEELESRLIDFCS